MYPSPSAPERRADMAVHLVGITAVVAGATFLLGKALDLLNPNLIAGVFIYAAFALASFAISAVYHLTPRHDLRAGLRRLDHAVIPVFQAATFTPLLLFAGTSLSHTILWTLWGLACIAVTIKFQGKLMSSRMSVVPNFLIGAVALIALVDFMSIMPAKVSVLIVMACSFYAFGSIFYARKKQKYRYAIWHSFVLLGSASFFMAIWICLFE